MIFLVQFRINKHSLIFSKTKNCTRHTSSCNFVSLSKNLLVLIYSKLHSKSCDYQYKQLNRTQKKQSPKRARNSKSTNNQEHDQLKFPTKDKTISLVLPEGILGQVCCLLRQSIFEDLLAVYLLFKCSTCDKPVYNNRLFLTNSVHSVYKNTPVLIFQYCLSA